MYYGFEVIQYPLVVLRKRAEIQGTREVDRYCILLPYALSALETPQLDDQDLWWSSEGANLVPIGMVAALRRGASNAIDSRGSEYCFAP